MARQAGVSGPLGPVFINETAKRQAGVGGIFVNDTTSAAGGALTAKMSAGASARAVPTTLTALAAKAKVFATRMAERHTAAMLHAMGAHGLRDEYPFVRHMTGAQIASFTDGSTEMMLERIFKDETLVR